MLTFREFNDICEGKKEERKQLVRAYLAGRERASEPKVVDYGTSAPNSPERQAQIAAMMKDQGGGAIRKVQKQQLKQATKAAKRIQKGKPVSEDIEARRQQLAQRQRENVKRFKEKSLASVEARKGAQQKQQEREELKKEIKRELQSEQHPVMEPNLYNKLIARRQASQKSAHIKHVHQELGAEARAQQAQKRAEMKAIMSR